MKSRLVAALALPMILASLGEVRAQQQITAGLLGYWKFDEGGSPYGDSSGGGHNFRSFWMSGIGGFAPRVSLDTAPLNFSNPASVEFDGIIGFLETSTTPIATVTDTFTISFWARPAAERGGVYSPRCAVFPFQSSVAGRREAGVSVGTNGIAVIERIGGSFSAVLTENRPIAAWTHVAVVYEDSAPRLYIDGALVQSGNPQGSGVIPGTGIAGGSDYGFGPYSGKLDDMRIYDRALATAELSALGRGDYMADYGPPAAATLAAGLPTRTSLTVSWSAPADDGMEYSSGPAQAYDLRCSSSGPIDGEAAFAAATRVPLAFAPAPPSYTQWTVVNGLHPATTYWFSLKSMDHAGAWSERSAPVSARTADDPAPPAPVSDLRAERIAPLMFRVSWTAPADDGIDSATGAVAGYDLRCSSVGPIAGDAAFAAAERLPAPGTPAAPGSRESIDVRVEGQGMEYFFALRARDYQPNWGPISNMASARSGFTGSSGAAAPCQGSAAGSAGTPALVLLAALVYFLSGAAKKSMTSFAQLE